jgi:hypothetical protein
VEKILCHSGTYLIVRLARIGRFMPFVALAVYGLSADIPIWNRQVGHG